MTPAKTLCYQKTSQGKVYESRSATIGEKLIPSVFAGLTEGVRGGERTQFASVMIERL